MKVAIRVDASIRIGLGHLIRCRTLATALREQGAEVLFICRAHPGHGIALLENESFAVATLPAPSTHAGGIVDADYAGWLGISQARDARETLTAIAGSHPDWLIVDHYGLDHEWERVLRPNVDRILAVDDLANRRHDADLLLDQNYAEDAEGRYAALLPLFAVRLLGPRYALLRPEYALVRRARRPRDGQVRRVLVFFGGTDPDDLTGRVLEVLADPALARLHLDLVIGANNPNRDRLVDRAAARPGTSLYRPRPHLADLMSAADLAIGAGGAATWERCCLGLPSQVVSIAENQRPTCMALAAAGVIQYLGHADQVDAVVLRMAIGQLVADPIRRDAMSMAGADLVDGFGVRRVVQGMQEETRGAL